MEEEERKKRLEQEKREEISLSETDGGKRESQPVGKKERGGVFPNSGEGCTVIYGRKKQQRNKKGGGEGAR